MALRILQRATRRISMNKGVVGICLFFVLLGFSTPVFAEQGTEAYQFLLGPGDKLEISVWKDVELTRQVVVAPDGKISFPLIGDVMAQGRTITELRGMIQGKIKEYVPDAPVAVMALLIESPKVYVVGKVNRPGMYIMDRPLRVMQVLAMAGGMNTFAKKDDIIIIRNEGNAQQVFPFNYSQVADGEELVQNILLEPGDTVVIP
jgi:polysaccharide export outer membrane protein